MISKPLLFSDTLMRWSRILFWSALFVIFYLAFSPDVDIGPDFDNADKLKHAAAFAVLTLLCLVGYRRRNVWMQMLAIGVFIEAVQYFLPYRDASFYDIIADAVGIFFISALYRKKT